jgi:hypothetical protein
MSLTKRYLESQPEFQGNAALIESAITDIRIASRIVDNIENLHDLSFSDLSDISRNLQLAVSRLEYLKESAEVAQ